MADEPPRRRPGRPPIDETDTTVGLSVRVSSKQFDQLSDRAERARMGLAEYVRYLIRATDRRRDEPRDE